MAHSVCEVFPDNVAIPLRFFHLWCSTPIKVKPSEFAYLSKGLQLCIPPYVESELIAAPYMWVTAPRGTTSFYLVTGHPFLNCLWCFRMKLPFSQLCFQHKHGSYRALSRDSVSCICTFVYSSHFTLTTCGKDSTNLELYNFTRKVCSSFYWLLKTLVCVGHEILDTTKNKSHET